MDYAKWTPGRRGKNKANSNPIKPNSNPISKMSKMNVISYLTRNYEQQTMNYELKNKPNSNPIYPVVASGEAGTNPISDVIRPFSVYYPFTSGLTVHPIWIIVDPFLSMAKWFDILDFVFIDLRQ